MKTPFWISCLDYFTFAVDLSSFFETFPTPVDDNALAFERSAGIEPLLSETPQHVFIVRCSIRYWNTQFLIDKYREEQDCAAAWRSLRSVGVVSPFAL